MRLTTVILIASLMQVSASTFGQRITINQDNAYIKSVFREIRKQSGYSFFYDGKIITEHEKVSVKITNVSVDEALHTVLNGLDLTYKIEGKIVSIKKKEPSFFDRIINRLAAIDVRGRVLDENGNPLVGASVKVKGTTINTLTNSNGEFYLENVEEDAVLQISYLGYKTLAVKATTEFGQVKMELVSSELEEVTVSTGYFSTSKARSTMNISKVDGKELENQPVTTLMNSLIGRVPGLDITPQNGFSGRASTIQIRGVNTLYSSNSYPLFVIDGVQIDSRPLQGLLSNNSGYDPLGGISPADVETIEVLKDAGATAIYGSRGANGVIRITTKRAKPGNGKTNLDFNVYSGGGQLTKKVKLLNSRQYMEMRREAVRNGGADPGLFDHDLTGVWDTTSNTNWQEELLGGTANINDLQGGFSGGNEFTSFRIGGSYHKETTIFPGDFAYQRATADFSFRHLSSDRKFEITASINFGNVNNDTYANGSFVDLALTLPPVAPKLYNDDGSLNWQIHSFFDGAFTMNTWENPMAKLLYTSKNITNSLVSSATLSYNLTSDIKLKTLVSLSNIYNSLANRSPIAALSPTAQAFTTASMTFADNNRKSVMIEPQISYNKDFGSHHINAVLGATFQQARNIYKTVEGLGYPSDALLGSTLGAASVTSLADDNTQYKYASTYLHLGYNYMGKYLFDITGRRDGSSRFGPGKRYGNFGAIAAGWVFTEEAFLKNNLSFLSFGKIRGSYGVTGNDQIGDYQYLDTYQPLSIGYQDAVSLVPTSLFNPDYAWESTKKFEIAAELGLFKNRIMIDVARYRNISSNQLINYSLSSQTGFDGVLTNFDATIENRGWEFTVTTKNIVKENFNWSTSFNYSAPRNKLLKFDDIENSSYKLTYKVGEPLSIQRRYIYKGVNPETGEFEIYDLNNDGTYDEENDQKFMNPLGRTSYAGVTNSMRYKNIELSFLLQFSKSELPFLFGNEPGSRINQPVQVLDRWQETGDKTKYQKYIPGGDVNYQRLTQSNFNTTDASFIRFKTLSVGYSFSKSLIERIKVQNAQIFLQGQNLFTITDFVGLDPETGNTMPPLSMVTLGLRLKL